MLLILLTVNPVKIIFVLLSITLFTINTIVSVVPDILDNIWFNTFVITFCINNIYIVSGIIKFICCTVDKSKKPVIFPIKKNKYNSKLFYSF